VNSDLTVHTVQGVHTVQADITLNSNNNTNNNNNLSNQAGNNIETTEKEQEIPPGGIPF